MKGKSIGAFVAFFLLGFAVRTFWVVLTSSGTLTSRQIGYEVGGGMYVIAAIAAILTWVVSKTGALGVMARRARGPEFPPDDPEHLKRVAELEAQQKPSGPPRV